MTTREHYIADLVDIVAMRIVCKKCGTATSFDPLKWERTSATCQNCRDTLFLDTQTGEPVDLFRIALKKWKEQEEGSRYQLQIDVKART
jgi:hypothetical protein